MSLPGLPANASPSAPKGVAEPIVHPLLGAAVSVTLAASTGLLADWSAAAAVLTASLGILSGTRVNRVVTMRRRR